MAEPALLAPDPFADLPFPEFQAPVDGDTFAFEDFDLEDLDLDLDVDFDLDLFASDGQLSQPPPLATSSSSAGSPEGGSSSSGGGGGLRNEESSESSSRSASGTDGSDKGKGEEDEAKRRARLVRNRESAHLSRQRKKQYVEELEGKVKAMQATIADLSARISCVTAENAALKQQLGGAAGAAPPLPMPMYPAMYPLPMPWMHPAYPMRGSQVPLVPIPRLKPQQPAPTAAEPPAKKARKTKKVASVSFLGLLCLAMLCGCLISVVHRMYPSVDAGEGAAFGPSHHGRILAVEGPHDNVSDGIDPKPPQSGSETLPALLYLPKNGKHVKINGNLVIKSIVASEKASLRLPGYDGTSPQKQKKEVTSLAIPGYVTPLEAGEVMESAKGVMKNELMALAPADGNVYREEDGLLPQWFSEAMSGPLLSSGMCTEVFQFDASPSSAHSNGIIPVYSNTMSNSSQNFTQKLPSACPRTVKNRRISYSEAIPLRGSTSNDTEHFKTPPKNESFGSTKPVSSVVVSVLADPREAGDGDGEGRISSKSLSRIFVVVLIDSVKYVTYSCVLPFKSHSPHL